MIIKVSSTQRNSTRMSVSRSYNVEQAAKVAEFLEKNPNVNPDVRWNGKTITFELNIPTK
jgi:hypothetical protein